MPFQSSQIVLQSPYVAWFCLLTMRSCWLGRHLGCRLVVEQVPHSQVDCRLAYYWVFWVCEYTGKVLFFHCIPENYEETCQTGNPPGSLQSESS